MNLQKPLIASDAAGYSNISWAGRRNGTPKPAQVNFVLPTALYMSLINPRVSLSALSALQWNIQLKLQNTETDENIQET